MRGLVNIIIILLVGGWLLGYIGYGAMIGNLIHVLLLAAVVMIILRVLAKI